jgi:hypothetical protein
METAMENAQHDTCLTSQEGIYLYAIIRHTGPIEFGHIGMGSKGELVYGIGYRDICVIVSRSSRTRYGARRLHLMTHELVLEEVMKQFTILPIRFSTISETYDESKVVAILKREYDKLSVLLSKMDGKMELNLKVIGHEGPVFNHILDSYENIRRAKDALAKLPPGKSHLQFVSVGEMVEKALQEENAKHRNIILNTLSPLTANVTINDNYGERMVVNVAFLIEEQNKLAFDSAINALDEKYGNLFSFKCVGPLPPYNFVNLVINV